MEVRGIEPLFSCFLKEASPKTARIVSEIPPRNRTKKRNPPSLIQLHRSRGAGRQVGIHFITPNFSLGMQRRRGQLRRIRRVQLALLVQRALMQLHSMFC